MNRWARAEQTPAEHIYNLSGCQPSRLQPLAAPAAGSQRMQRPRVRGWPRHRRVEGANDHALERGGEEAEEEW